MQIKYVFDPYNYGLNFIADFIQKNQHKTYRIFLSTTAYKKLAYSILTKKFGITSNEELFPYYPYGRLHTFFLDKFAPELEPLKVNVAEIIDFFYNETFYRKMAIPNKRQHIYNNYLAYCLEREGLDNSKYVQIETYEKFKKIFIERKIADDVNIYRYILEKPNITPIEIDVVFFINAEDMLKIAFEALKKCIKCETLILVGDTNKVKRYEFTPVEIPSFEFNLSGANVVGKKHAKMIMNSASEYRFDPFVSENVGDIQVEVKNAAVLLKQILIEVEGYNTVKLVYPDYSYQTEVEQLLYNMSIPFRGLIPEYRLPFSVYFAVSMLRSIINKEDKYFNKKQICNFIDMLSPRITDRFGGRAKIKKMFYEYLYHASILSKLKLFETLKKMYFDNKLEYAFKAPYCIEYLKWHNKLNKNFFNPKIFVAPIHYAKNYNTELTICFYNKNTIEAHGYKRTFYTCLTSTSKKIILCDINSLPL